ncbi:MAG: hypothetical protein Q4D38_12270 [Planctomycetia bacterium]|nr:hypothetical protein [Planctomycetia bacterium]
MKKASAAIFKRGNLEVLMVYTRSPLKFPFYATLCEPWCVAPTADGTGNFNAKYYNCFRQHVNINGVINIDTLATCVTFPSTINAQTTIKLLKKLLSRHGSETVIHVFVDDTKYCHSKLLRRKRHLPDLRTLITKNLKVLGAKTGFYNTSR